MARKIKSKARPLSKARGSAPVLGSRESQAVRHALIESAGSRVCISYRPLTADLRLRMLATIAEMQARQRSEEPEAGTSGAAARGALRSPEELTMALIEIVAGAIEDVSMPDGVGDDGRDLWSSSLLPLSMPVGDDTPAAYWCELDAEERQVAMLLHQEVLFAPIIQDGLLLRRAPARIAGEFSARPGAGLHRAPVVGEIQPPPEGSSG